VTGIGVVVCFQSLAGADKLSLVRMRVCIMREILIHATLSCFVEFGTYYDVDTRFVYNIFDQS